MNRSPNIIFFSLTIIAGSSFARTGSTNDPKPTLEPGIVSSRHQSFASPALPPEPLNDIRRPALERNSCLGTTSDESASSVGVSLAQNYPVGGGPFDNPFVRPALFIGGALAITGVMIRTDQQTYDGLYDWKQDQPAIGRVSPVITNLGDGRASIAIFGGFLAYSYLGHDKTAFEAGKIGLESFLVSGIATQIFKHTFGRERPSVASVSGGRWNGPFLLFSRGSGNYGRYSHFDAFPSGHTATAFAAATTLSEVYSDSPWVSYASYSVASIVALSRVMERTHWVSDCFVGGLIGYFSTQLVLRLNHNGKPVALVPVTDGRYEGLALNVGL